jgi:alpha-L-arabinofuranosidase
MNTRSPRALRLLVVLGVATSLLVAQSAPAKITIDASKVEGRVSPKLYGQFAEFMFENIKGGMHAELVRNRSFEEAANAIGLSRHWEREPDDRNDDPAMRLHWDDSVSYPPAKTFDRPEIEHALRLDISHADGQRRGVSQGRMPLRAGTVYKGYVWLKSTGYDGHVTVGLEADQTGGETYASADLRQISNEWKRYEFTLTPAKSDPLAKLVVLFHGRGRIWLDQVSLMPGDAVETVRADVSARIQALRPAFIRWPGGNVAQDYHWMWGIGPRDERITWSNLSWWNEPEPSDFGTDEFLAFSRKMNAEPHLVVNVEGRGATAEEAAAWVEYTNGVSTTKFGAMRAANGHAQPYAVKTWEIGNEIWGDWVRGHSDAGTYATNCQRYIKAMRAVDPGIQIIAVGDNDMRWNRTVLRDCGPHIDLLAIHHYYGLGEMAGDPLNLMARPLFYERFYREVGKAIKELAPGKNIKLIINEWNTSLPVPRQHSMESALYGARLMNVFERSGDIVEHTAVSDLVNGWIGGIIQASRHGVFVTPTYWAIKLYNDNLGTERLTTQVQSPLFDATKEGKQVPYLDVVATRSADRKRIHIKAVNTDRDRALKTTVNLAGARVSPRARMQVLTASRFEDANSFTTPNAVAIREDTINAGESFTVELPKHSVAVITLETL